MIKEQPDGRLLLSFANWTVKMKVLAERWHQLPLPPDACPTRTHEVGIDRLSKLQRGKMAIQTLLDNVDDFAYCPNHRQVVQLGKSIIKFSIDLDRLLHQRQQPLTRRQINKAAWAAVNRKGWRPESERLAAFDRERERLTRLRGRAP